MDPTLYMAARDGKIRGDGHFILADHLKRDEEKGYQVTAAQGNTVLHVAAFYGQSGFVEEVLKISPALLCYQNRKNETALHVAVIHGYTDCARLIWQQNKSLCEEADKRGWIPLHYAVKLGLKELVYDMLSWKKSLAYLRAGSDNDWTTMFHIAAGAAHVDMIYHLSKDYPDWWEVLNSRGQNVLHVAIANDQESVVEFWLTSENKYFLAFEQDKDGNTPFDLPDVSSSSVTGKFMFHLSKQKKFLKSTDFEYLDFIVRTCIQKSKNENTQEDESDPEFEKEIDFITKAIQMHLVVATLVMTVTFAAGFTLSGGFDSDAGPNKGMAILTRKAAFQAFVVVDAIAFTLSACEIFIYYLIAVIANLHERKLGVIIFTLFFVATFMQIFAMLAIVVAFVTGMYATLQHSAGLAITVCIIGCTSFPIFFWVLFWVLRYVFKLINMSSET